MAKRSGPSQTAVSRIWRAFGLQPHRSERSSSRKIRCYINKVRDTVGSYLDPPDARPLGPRAAPLLNWSVWVTASSSHPPHERQVATAVFFEQSRR
jgi:hypothetical protein